MTIETNLSPEEIRIIGCLMEKKVLTPDLYPLTLNTLRNACNQKSSREPVMALEPGLVTRTARQLEEKNLVKSSDGKGGVEKYSQHFCNSLHADIKLSEPEYAIITLLLLRGPQTPGELKARSGRLYTFDEYDEVKDILNGLINRESGALIARLPRQSGRKDHEYVHLFGAAIASVPEEAAITGRTPASPKAERVSRLETRVSILEQALTELAQRLGEEVNLDQVNMPADQE